MVWEGVGRKGVRSEEGEMREEEERKDFDLERSA
jgi:hypothetical protein